MNREGWAARLTSRRFYPIYAALLAAFLCGIAMALCGYNPFRAYGGIMAGALGGRRAILNTLTTSTPLIFQGLAFTVAKKAGVFNLGVEGQMYMGALGATLVGILPLGIPASLHIAAALLAGVLLGGLYAGLLGIFRERMGLYDVIGSIMLNSIAALFVSYLVSGPLAAGDGLARTERIAQSAQLPRLFAGGRLTAAFLLAVIACVVVKLFFDRTALGYEMRVVGLNPKAAATAGIRTSSAVMLAVAVSGCIAGLGGGAFVPGDTLRLYPGFLLIARFDCLGVAALALESPTGVILSGIFFGALRNGAMEVNRDTGMPTEFMDIVMVLVVILAIAPLVFDLLFQKRGLRREIPVAKAGPAAEGGK